MTSRTSPHSVLVADDESEIRELVRILLETDGFDVLTDAVDGAEAVERFVELDPPPVPSVVVLDQRMPRLTGLEAAEQILRHRPDQVVVIFSAMVDELMEQRARTLGVAACVSKLDAAELPTILRGLLAA